MSTNNSPATAVQRSTSILATLLSMRPTDLTTILFDLGGVLTSDPWQSILLTPEDGVVDRMRLNRTIVEDAAARLWPKYSLGRHGEAEYWTELGAAVGVEFDPELVAQAESSTVRVNRQWAGVLTTLRRRGMDWGTISDNTPFWYAKQLRMLAVGAATPPAHQFLSFDFGAAKTGTTPDLFHLAAGLVSPPATLVVDDRDRNLQAAETAGFSVVKYEMAADGSGSGLVDVVGGL